MRQARLKGDDSRLMEQKENFLAVQCLLPACGQSKLNRKLKGFEPSRQQSIKLFPITCLQACTCLSLLSLPSCTTSLLAHLCHFHKWKVLIQSVELGTGRSCSFVARASTICRLSYYLRPGSNNNLPTILFSSSSPFAAWVRSGCSFPPETLTTGLQTTKFSFLVRPVPGWIKHETRCRLQSPTRIKLHCIPLSDIQDNSCIQFFTFPSEQDAGSSWRFCSG
jgi:hypothetical protein